MKLSACELTRASLCDFLSKLQVETRRPAVSFGSGVETSGMWSDVQRTYLLRASPETKCFNKDVEDFVDAYNKRVMVYFKQVNHLKRGKCRVFPSINTRSSPQCKIRNRHDELPLRKGHKGALKPACGDHSWRIWTGSRLALHLALAGEKQGSKVRFRCEIMWHMSGESFFDSYKERWVECRRGPYADGGKW